MFARLFSLTGLAMNRLLFLLTFGVTGAAILIALGVWQVQRLEWKESLLADIEARISAAPMDLPAQPEPDRDEYLPVEAQGTILPGELAVLVSRKNIGAGYRIIAPFRTADGRRILLDRGFVRDDNREAVRTLGPAVVTGNLHWPDETDRFTPEPDRATETWFARDVATMARALDTEPMLLVARSQTDPGITPLPVGTEGIPNDHMQYAITWFSLAVVWIVMTAYFLWRPRARKTGKVT